MSKYYKAEDVYQFFKIGKYNLDLEELKADMENGLPTIDIVYCKDCRWSEPNREGDYDCKCHIPIFRVPEDGWCYLGERIEE